MKLLKNTPSSKYPFSESQKWIKCSSLGDPRAQIIIGVVIGVLLMELLRFLYSTFIFTAPYSFALYKKIHIFILAILVHEALHLLALPNPSKAAIGLAPKKLIFFISTNCLMTGYRLVFVFLLPFFLLTALPSILICFYPSNFIADIALCNAVGSGLDILFAWIVFFNPYPLRGVYATDEKNLYVYKKSIGK